MMLYRDAPDPRRQFRAGLCQVKKGAVGGLKEFGEIGSVAANYSFVRILSVFLARYLIHST